MMARDTADRWGGPVTPGSLAVIAVCIMVLYVLFKLIGMGA